MTSLWCRGNEARGEGFACMVGARTLQTAWTHAVEGFSLVMGVLVRKGGMGGVGGTEHTAERRRLGTGQGAHGSDGGRRTVLMNAPLGVNRTLLTGPEERSVSYMILNLDCFPSTSLKLIHFTERENRTV